MQVGVMVMGAGAIYGGIRADLKGMREAIARVERAIDMAHQRIDGCVVHGHRRSGDDRASSHHRLSDEGG